jgi:hypothetical protein
VLNGLGAARNIRIDVSNPHSIASSVHKARGSSKYGEWEALTTHIHTYTYRCRHNVFQSYIEHNLFMLLFDFPNVVMHHLHMSLNH